MGQNCSKHATWALIFLGLPDADAAGVDHVVLPEGTELVLPKDPTTADVGNDTSTSDDDSEDGSSEETLGLPKNDIEQLGWLKTLFGADGVGPGRREIEFTENVGAADGSVININSLPDNALLRIFKSFPYKFVLLSLRLVCKKWYVYCRDHEIWQNKVVRGFRLCEHVKVRSDCHHFDWDEWDDSLDEMGFCPNAFKFGYNPLDKSDCECETCASIATSSFGDKCDPCKEKEITEDDKLDAELYGSSVNDDYSFYEVDQTFEDDLLFMKEDNEMDTLPCMTNDDVSNLLHYTNNLKLLSLTRCLKLTNAGLAKALMNGGTLKGIFMPMYLPLKGIVFRSMAFYCKNLEKLTISSDEYCVSYSVPESAFKLIGYLGKLKHLTLRHCNTLNDDALEVIFQHCDQLSYVRLEHNGGALTQLTVKTLEALASASLQHLQHVRICEAFVGSGFGYLAKLQRLKTLHLETTKSVCMEPQDWITLSNGCLELEEISFRTVAHVGSEDVFMSMKTNLKKLRKFRLGCHNSENIKMGEHFGLPMEHWIDPDEF